jgi:hypothetical protein
MSISELQIVTVALYIRTNTFKYAYTARSHEYQSTFTSFIEIC